MNVLLGELVAVVIRSQKTLQSEAVEKEGLYVEEMFIGEDALGICLRL